MNISPQLEAALMQWLKRSSPNQELSDIASALSEVNPMQDPEHRPNIADALYSVSRALNTANELESVNGDPSHPLHAVASNIGEVASALNRIADYLEIKA
jgi:HAMP domain-containing protein